ncbi:hypothetical protein A5N78_20595 [Prescottella equi]|nr:hypothetical protein A5N78_20595 [Prescottella equi]ORM13207.1 hypothetical protein A5N70_20965 [Prescottella equi]
MDAANVRATGLHVLPEIALRARQGRFRLSGTDFGNGATEGQTEQVCRETLDQDGMPVSTRRNVHEPACQ